MSKEYNEWYWKLYRWFKWDAKYFPKRFITGVKNLWKWFPIIWKDRDYDHDYIFNILKFKLEQQAKQFIKSGYTESAEREAELMMTCVRLIDKIQDEYYFEEMYHYEKLTSEIVNQYMAKHDKAKRLLFKILNDKIETWWY
jgi:Txe/YoeB family toxin of Txe-Axe toxin-antitoxin module